MSRLPRVLLAVAVATALAACGDDDAADDAATTRATPTTTSTSAAPGDGAEDPPAHADIHTVGFLDRAVRGQLARSSIFELELS